MNEIDLKILEILKKNSRTKYVTIGEEIGLTEGAVRRRIEKMMEAGAAQEKRKDLEALPDSAYGFGMAPSETQPPQAPRLGGVPGHPLRKP